MQKFQSLFTNSLTGNIIGMIHVLALPGTPGNTKTIDEIISYALYEAGVDAIEIENMHDTPYLNTNVGPEIISFMTAICYAVRENVPVNIPVGIQILAAANKEAIAVAKACNLSFIRCEGYIFSHIADEAELLRYRKYMEADDILIFSDIKKKHSSHAITSDVNLLDTINAAIFFRSDGIILTGNSTGDATSVKDLNTTLGVMNKNRNKIPILIGSGVTFDNVSDYINANAMIIGSHFKEEGYWENPLSETRVKNFCEKVKSLRNNSSELNMYIV